MASIPRPREPDEKSYVLPTDQLHPKPSHLADDVTKCSNHEVANDNPMSSMPQKATFYQTPEQLTSSFRSSLPNQPQHGFVALGLCTSFYESFLTQARKDQPLSEDEIRSPNTMIKMENVDDSHWCLDTLHSPQLRKSHTNSEEPDGKHSSQTPDSDESSSTTETYIDDRKKQVIESVVFTVIQWLHLKFDVWRKNVGGNSKSSSGTSEALLDSHLRTGSFNSNNRDNKKRKAADRDDRDTDNEDESDKREGPRSSEAAIKEHGDLKYACPYFKYNPAKYKDWRTCPGPGWNDVHRIKEHLYRRHRQPQYRCARCWQPFTDEQGVVDHQRTNIPCLLREMEYVEGFDAGQERSLRSRKRVNQKLTEAEKWRRVFSILFPHILEDDIPSPFYDYRQGSQKDDDCHTESGYLAQCEQYMLREVPQRLRQALGRELDRDMTIVEENLRRRAGDWVKTLLEEAFQELRQIRRLGSPAQQPEPSSDIPAPPRELQLPISELPSVEGADLHFEGEGGSWLDTFDFGSIDPSSIFGELQSSFDSGGLIEDLLKSGEDGAGEAARQSDSGYVSNSPE